MLQKFKDFASMACMSSLLAGLLGVDLWVMGEYGLLTALVVMVSQAVGFFTLYLIADHVQMRRYEERCLDLLEPLPEDCKDLTS